MVTNPNEQVAGKRGRRRASRWPLSLLLIGVQIKKTGRCDRETGDERHPGLFCKPSSSTPSVALKFLRAP